MEYTKSHIYPVKEYRKQNKEMFFRRNRSALKLSAAARDFLLPCRYVKFEIGNDYLRIIPSTNADDYIITLFNGQASICYQRMQRFIDIPNNTRISLTIDNDNSLVAQI